MNTFYNVLFFTSLSCTDYTITWYSHENSITYFTVSVLNAIAWFQNLFIYTRIWRSMSTRANIRVKYVSRYIQTHSLQTNFFYTFVVHTHYIHLAFKSRHSMQHVVSFNVTFLGAIYNQYPGISRKSFNEQIHEL